MSAIGCRVNIWGDERDTTVTFWGINKRHVSARPCSATRTSTLINAHSVLSV